MSETIDIKTKKIIPLSSENNFQKSLVLDNLEKIKICIDYGPIDYQTFNTSDMKYIEMEGWKSSTVGITNYDELPENAKKYIKTIEEISKTKVVMISTGPSRDQIIVLEDIFK